MNQREPIINIINSLINSQIENNPLLSNLIITTSIELNIRNKVLKDRLLNFD